MSQVQVKRARAVRFGIAVAVIAVVAATAGTSSGSDKTAAGGGTFTYRAASDWFTMDFQTRATGAVIAASFAAYDTLTRLTPAGGLVGDLASSWTVAPKNRPKVFTFVIKKGITCDDGHVLTATDVMNSMNRFITVPKLVNNVPQLFGNGPFTMKANDNPSGGGGTFTFTTQTPFANMLLGFSESGIICPAGLAAAAADPTALQAASYGTGPYKLVSATHNVNAIWQKKSTYTWGPPGVELYNLPDTVIWSDITDQTTAANEVLTGQVDYATILGPDVQRLASNSSLQHDTYQDYFSKPLIFNQENGHVTQDPKVREALMMAINMKDFAAAAGYKGTIDPSVLNPKDPCYDPNIQKYVPQYNISGAQKVLEADGYTLQNGVMMKNGQPLHIRVLMSTDLTGGAGQYLLAQDKAVGFDVDLADVDATTYSIQGNAENFDESIVFNNAPFSWKAGRAYSMSTWIGKGLQAGGSNRGWTGRDSNAYQQAALYATERTDCKWWIKFQELALQNYEIYPTVEITKDSFGDKRFQGPFETAFYDPIWLKPYQSNHNG